MITLVRNQAVYAAIAILIVLLGTSFVGAAAVILQ